MKQTKRKPGQLHEEQAAKLVAWNLAWHEYWEKTKSYTYELPEGSAVWQERDFLMHPRSPEHEQARLELIVEEFIRGFETLYDLGPAVTVFGSARFKEGHPYYQLGVEVGKELVKAGFAVITGGGPGIMEAANRGADEAGGVSIGCNIILPHEQQPNAYLDRSIAFHYFFVRKVMLAKYSCAFITMPGGIGTLDEMFEAATLIQTAKMGPFPLVCIGKEFWKQLTGLLGSLVENGTVNEQELHFLQYTDSPREAVDLIVGALPEPVRESLKVKSMAEPPVNQGER